MSKPRDLGKERFWREVLTRWQRSGQTVAEFCVRHGLSQASFYQWKRTLARRESSAATFVPLRVLEENNQAGRQDDDCGVEIVLNGGRRLRVAPGFDRPTLAAVLDVLEGQAC